MKINTKDMVLVSLFAALTAVGAFIQIPIGPAPITLQVLFTALAGVILGSRLGALSQMVYVFLGLVGLPIFAGGTGGISTVFTPSFGYLIGFIVGAYIIGKISETTKVVNFTRLFIASLTGMVVIYAIGVPYLYIILKDVSGVGISVAKALKIGMLIFIPGDIAKCILTAVLGVKIIPIIKRQAI
ncbi:biotin transporter BioY [Clostridium tepidiprofundi DSM 19306]|uniref:Biotin transporter n=1 Tax=Clostridium tepidiprofundi DSM 19306 TaxID=1121338 RepID=A0A151B694_9CLOT|nr:biotin transporter BioY [Clostridium tepidiprofundi]KYH35448.1 biotin transporter BioY [Clostridium tepidiprofundi DSM 19306]